MLAGSRGPRGRTGRAAAGRGSCRGSRAVDGAAGSRPAPTWCWTGWSASAGTGQGCAVVAGELVDGLLDLGRPYVVAVDLPSGIGVDDGDGDGTVLDADLTVTFGGVKPGLLLPPGAPGGRSRRGRRHRARPVGRTRRRPARAGRRRRPVACTDGRRAQVHPRRGRGRRRVPGVPGCRGPRDERRRAGRRRHGALPGRRRRRGRRGEPRGRRRPRARAGVGVRAGRLHGRREPATPDRVRVRARAGRGRAGGHRRRRARAAAGARRTARGADAARRRARARCWRSAARTSTGPRSRPSRCAGRDGPTS